jgi:hypothetical protein
MNNQIISKLHENYALDKLSINIDPVLMTSIIKNCWGEDFAKGANYVIGTFKLKTGSSSIYYEIEKLFEGKHDDFTDKMSDWNEIKPIKLTEDFFAEMFLMNKTKTPFMFILIDSEIDKNTWGNVFSGLRIASMAGNGYKSFFIKKSGNWKTVFKRLIWIS